MGFGSIVKARMIHQGPLTILIDDRRIVSCRSIPHLLKRELVVANQFDTIV